MISAKQKWILCNYTRQIIPDWYNSQPDYNSAHPNRDVNWRDKILGERLERNDFDLVNALIGELIDIAKNDKPFDKEELIIKLNNL